MVCYSLNNRLTSNIMFIRLNIYFFEEQQKIYIQKTKNKYSKIKFIAKNVIK